MALRGDCKLQCLTRRLRIEDVASAFSASYGLEIPTFIWTGYRVFIDTVTACNCVGERQIFGVHLDDGSAVYTSSDAEFVTRDGDIVVAAEIESGTSLMPLYLSKDSHGYPIYKENNPEANKTAPCSTDRAPRRKICRLVAEWKLGHRLEPGTFVEHIDGDRKNCGPDNLKISFKPESVRKSTNYPITQAVKDGQDLIQEIKESKLNRHNELPDNHKVDYVEIMSVEPVYEIVTSCGAVSVSGVFINANYC